MSSQLWCFNVQKFKNPRRTSDFSLLEVKPLLPFLLLNLSFQQPQEKLLSFGFLVNLYLFLSLELYLNENTGPGTELIKLNYSVP